MASTSNKNNGLLLSEKSIIVANENKISFSGYIKEKRKLEASPSGKMYLSTKELAKRLDIDYEQFRKIINKNKPTKKRDCIIAICAALGLNSEETNKALVLYQYMPVLDTSNPRDDLLIEILEEQFSNPLTIAEINQRLLRNGFPELDIIDHRPSTKPASKKNNAPYRLLKKQARTFSDDLIFGDQYDSLDFEYSLFRYRCIAEMWLDDSKQKRVYHLSAGTHHDYIMNIQGKNLFDIKSFKNLEDAGIFKDYFLELEGMANHELKKMYAILNDTKNYQTRISAGICDDMLHVYAETYNYTVPELGEYYLFEYKKGITIFSVYQNSEFMHLYLDTKEYLSTYGCKPNTLIAQYNSIDELNKQSENGTSEYLLKCRSRYFKQLKADADALIKDIKAKKRYIRHLDYIYDDRDRVCQFFNVDKEFQCTLDNDYGDMMTAGVDAVDFQFDDYGKVHITLDDLYTAFELGFSNINEICRVKNKLSSIKKII